MSTQTALDKIREALASPEILDAQADVYERNRAEFESMLLTLRDQGAKQKNVDALARAVRARVHERKPPRLRAVEQGERAAPAFVLAKLEGAPVGPNIIVPAGYDLDASGVAPVGDVPIAPGPIVLAGRAVDLATGNECVRLAWLRDGHWQFATVDRAQLSDARQIVALSARGFPVTSLNARALVAYLAAFEAANLETLPRATVVDHLGWAGDDLKTFLSGRQVVTAEGVEAVDLEADAWAGRVAFRGADAGNEQLADGYRTSGTLKAWRAMYAETADYPRVRFLVVAAFAAALLRVVGALSFLVDLCGETSRGKSTALRLAGAAWGCPDETQPAATVTTFDATAVYLERMAATLDGLPLLVDDTKRARRPEDVARLVYTIASGRGRGRGSLQGVRQTGSWRTVALTTGERPITSFTTGDGGTHARAVVLWGEPFGSSSAASLVRRLNAAALENYGHAGVAFVRFLLAHRDQWPAWRERYATLRDELAGAFPESPVADRLAGCVAVVELAEQLAAEALDVNASGAALALWPAIVGQGAEGADRATAALHDVLSWATANEHRFWERAEVIPGKRGSSPDLDTPDRCVKPSGGWFGRWDNSPQWAHLDLFPDPLRHYLNGEGYEAEAVLRTWRDRGWLSTGNDRNRTTKKVKFGDNGQTVWMVVIRREAFNPAPVPNSGNPVGTTEPLENRETYKDGSHSSPSSHNTCVYRGGGGKDGGEEEHAGIFCGGAVSGGNGGNGGNRQRNQRLTDASSGNPVGTSVGIALQCPTCGVFDCTVPGHSDLPF